VARSCSICVHPKRLNIEADILRNDASNRRISTHYGMSEASVRRHIAEHMGAAVEKAQESREVLAGDNLIEEIKRIKRETQAIYLEARANSDLRTALAALDKQTKQVEVLAEMMLKIEEVRQRSEEREPIVVTWRVIKSEE
jgi:hypothetical protein